MENEIKKLIEKYKDHYSRSSTIYIHMVVRDLESFLEFKKNNCCGKQTPSGIKEMYEKYNHLDHLLSDKEWMTPDKSDVSPAYTICYELWRAIKNECA